MEDHLGLSIDKERMRPVRRSETSPIGYRYHHTVRYRYKKGQLLEKYESLIAWSDNPDLDGSGSLLSIITEMHAT